eukprot:3088885-Pleurochrysis_carterae.AAC.2
MAEPLQEASQNSARPHRNRCRFDTQSFQLATQIGLEHIANLTQTRGSKFDFSLRPQIGSNSRPHKSVQIHSSSSTPSIAMRSASASSSFTIT